MKVVAFSNRTYFTINKLIINMKKGFILLSLLLVMTQCGNNHADGQVIPGTDGITIERCNEIVNALGDPKYFSKELGDLAKEFEQLSQNDDLMASLLGGIGGSEFMCYWHSGNGEQFDENAQKTYTLVSGSENKADLLLNMNEVFYNEDGGEAYRLDNVFHMIMVKENGQWMLDDWCQTYGGDEWSSRKQELKDYNDGEKELVYVHYEGQMEDENDPRPFKAFFAINKKENDEGKQPLMGAIRFDNKEDEYYDLIDGTLEKDGSIVFSFQPDENSEYHFWGTIAPDFQTITGEFQVYALAFEGRMVFSRDFIMKAME